MTWRDGLIGNMTPVRAARWAKLRQKGRRHFIWLYGVAVMGIGMFMLNTLADFYFESGLPTNSAAVLFLSLSINLLASLLAGYIFAVLLWRISERQYNKFQLQQNKVNANNT